MSVASRIVPLLVTVSCLAAATNPSEAFASLHSLLGEWEAKTTGGSLIRVSYRTISRDSAIVETYATSKIETLTIFHLDGPALLATHYCAQGNQPRLRLQPQSTQSDFQFSFYDATNLESPNASHLVRLRFQLRDPDHFDKTEIYTQDGQEEVTVLHFSRVKKS